MDATHLLRPINALRARPINENDVLASTMTLENDSTLDERLKYGPLPSWLLIGAYQVMNAGYLQHYILTDSNANSRGDR